MEVTAEGTTRSSATFDLAVIGAGPGGSAAAITAARLGAKVVLIEAGEFPRQKVCGEFVSAESLDVLRDLLLRQLPRRTTYCVPLPSSIEPGCSWQGESSDTVRPPALSIPRYELDRLLWQAAQQAGARTIGNCEVREIEGNGPFRLVTATGGDSCRFRDRRRRPLVAIQARHFDSGGSQVGRTQSALSRATDCTFHRPLFF